MEPDKKSTIVLDNGSGFIKLGWAGLPVPKYIMPNCMGTHRKRQNVRHFADHCYLLPEYFCHRPFSHGLLVDLDLQRDIWDKAFGKGYLNCSTEGLSIFVTEPFLSPAAIRHSMCEILFEDFQFSQALILPAQYAAPYGFWGRSWAGVNASSSLYSKEASNFQVLCCDSGGKSGYNTDCFPGNLLKNIEATPNATLIDTEQRASKTRAHSGSKNFSDHKREVHELSCKPGVDTSFDEFYKHGEVVRNPCCLVLDCGFSSCQTMSFFNCQPLQTTALRIDIGGFHLNTVLKNLMAFRSVDLGQNELLIQHLKERCCYVSRDFSSELFAAKKWIRSSGRPEPGLHDLRCEFELPDYGVKNDESKANLSAFYHSEESSNINEPIYGTFKNCAESTSESRVQHKTELQLQDSLIMESSAPSENQHDFQTFGYADATDEGRQAVMLGSERITVPELLFCPQDAHLSECGVAELVCRSISLAPVEMQPLLARQILLVGGSTKFCGFKERLLKELRMLLPEQWRITVYQHAKGSSESIWRGISDICGSQDFFLANCITRSEFLESGNSKFAPCSDSWQTLSFNI